MGMFDEIYGEVKCPHCKKIIGFETQTKEYECMMDRYTIGDYMEKGNVTSASLIEKDWYCTDCKNPFDVSIVFVRGQIIKFINNNEFKDINVNKLDNIEEGLGHRLEYEELCRQGVGYAKETVDLEEHPKNVGSRIKVLNQDWLITEIYKENLVTDKGSRVYSLHKLWFENGFVYKVTNKLGDRFIRVAEQIGFKGGYSVFYDEGNYKEYDHRSPHNFIIQFGCELEEI